MPLECGNGFCTPCEPNARIWHKGNDPIGRRSIAIIFVDVDLQQFQRHHLAWRIPLVKIPLTVWASMNVPLLATKWWAPAKRLAPLMSRYRWWRFRIRVGKKGQHPNVGDPQSRDEVLVMITRRALVYFYIVHAIPVRFSDSLWQLTVFGEWARLSCVLVLYGTYRAHDERMKSVVSAERAYWTDDREESKLRTRQKDDVLGGGPFYHRHRNQASPRAQSTMTHVFI